MAFDLFDTVRIVNTNIVGDIVEIIDGKDNNTYYLVQSDTEGSENDPKALIPGSCPIYECVAEELEKISD